MEIQDCIQIRLLIVRRLAFGVLPVNVNLTRPQYREELTHSLEPKMKIAAIAICTIALIALGVIAVAIARPHLVKTAFRSKAERDYLRLVGEEKTEVYVGYPELVERMVKDKQYAATVTTVHLLGPKGESMDFASLRELPNLATVTVDYCHKIEAIIATLNTLSALKEARFYYCGAPDLILQSVDNASLTSIAIHSYQPSTDTDQIVRETMDRLPNCTIRLTSD
jgi:hypothetical protein